MVFTDGFESDKARIYLLTQEEYDAKNWSEMMNGRWYKDYRFVFVFANDSTYIEKMQCDQRFYKLYPGAAEVWPPIYNYGKVLFYLIASEKMTAEVHHGGNQLSVDLDDVDHIEKLIAV